MTEVLVIDDDPIARETLHAILEAGGYSVTCAADGREGLARFNNKRPDVVVTDIIMPDIEGLETIRTLRSAWPAGPIIAISGGSRIVTVDYLEFAKQLGADAVLSKPFEPSDLLDAVKSLVR